MTEQEIIFGILTKNKQVFDEFIDNRIREKHPFMQGQEWYSSQQAAVYLNRTKRTLDNYCYKGRINFKKVGQKREFHIDDLNDFRERNTK